jgi:Diadenosine tetraphosphate (Ap4A) hydrolase and other HIT family hydrolases
VPATDDDTRACLPCQNTAAADLPARERILRTRHWRVAHAFTTGLPGWLVLLPTRHITALTELDPDAAAELGPLLRDLSQALREVVGCVKTYIVLLAEAERFSHVHFHVIPRMRDQPEQLRGPGIFGMLGLPPEQCVPDAEMDRIAECLSVALATNHTGRQAARAD